MLVRWVARTSFGTVLGAFPYLISVVIVRRSHNELHATKSGQRRDPWAWWTTVDHGGPRRAFVMSPCPAGEFNHVCGCMFVCFWTFQNICVILRYARYVHTCTCKWVGAMRSSRYERPSRPMVAAISCARKRPCYDYGMGWNLVGFFRRHLICIFEYIWYLWM